MKEEWRPIPLPDLSGFLVSSLGRIAKLVFLSNGTGYYRLNIRQGRDNRYKASYPVARLVALAFLGEPPNSEYEPHHRNYEPTDNRPENLEWRHRDEHGNRQRRLTEDDAREILRLRGRGMVKPLAERFGVSTHLIERIWSHDCWVRVNGPAGERRPNPIGSNNGNALVTEEDVRVIRHERGVTSGKVLAERYHISPQAVWAIWRRQNWKHVPD